MDLPVAGTSTLNTQHSQETDKYAPGGIRTRNLCKRKTADPCLRSRGHHDRRNVKIGHVQYIFRKSVAKFQLGDSR